MEAIMQDLSDAALVAAIEANSFSLGALMRRWSRAEIHDDGDLLWCITDIPFPLFNCLLRANLPPESVDATIEAAIARGRARSVPLLWFTGPATRPPDLGRALETHGFARAGSSPGMAVDLLALQEPVPAAGLAIERVRDDDALQQWSRIMVRGFGLPDELTDVFRDSNASIGLEADLPVRHYLGRLDGTPVAVSSLILAAGVAGIWNVATLPEARRQGIGAAMTAAPLRAARELGYRVGVLTSSEMGAGVYARLGFREYCTIEQYLWANEANSNVQA